MHKIMHNEMITLYSSNIIIFLMCYPTESKNGDYGRWKFGRSRKNFTTTRYAILSGTD